MSQENVEVVRRLFTTLDSQDWEAALGLFDPEVEWSPTEGNFHGLEGVVTSLAEWLEPWAGMVTERLFVARQVAAAGA